MSDIHSSIISVSFRKKKPTVLITRMGVSEQGIKLLELKCNIVTCTTNCRSEILEKCKGVEAILWADLQKLDKEIIDAAGPQLKVISTMSAGTDYIDKEILNERSIALGYTAKIVVAAKADLAIGLMIAAARRFHEGRRKILTCDWDLNHITWMLGYDIRGSTVGLIGFGSLGEMIVKRLSGFDVNTFLYYCPENYIEPVPFQAKSCGFNDLLKQSDFIFISCYDGIENLIDENAFSKMKRNCVLINVTRAKIVDQTALYNALKDNKIFAAGLDVTIPVPLPYNDRLLTLPNCIITPHLGTATPGTRENMAIVAAYNILQGLAGEPLLSTPY